MTGVVKQNIQFAVKTVKTKLTLPAVNIFIESSA